ncbi:hypothetical protein [Streptomyces wuyuanensis]|uniref:Uncharacterized protein n=1 Tax=Streptomyces wuyuanensis TaxID=1196353 RepID=A0A1G9ZC48_9ACTN|nr:hypothetical protein [Streptomyces wuyuanensis]SDN18745.1 hypothetical protein SAMN05444921_12171 [Streptomyces wuyuanensis]
MTINHRAEAIRLVEGVLRDPEFPELGNGGEGVIAAAQVHATLAAGETAAADVASYRHAIHTYRFALIRQVAEGLALSEGDEAHQHALGLAKYLDSVDLNIDREVDAYIEDIGWGDPRNAWLSPTARKAKRNAEIDVPF